MLNQEFKPVASMHAVGAAKTMRNVSIIHALFHDHDSTLCSKVESLDSVTMIGRFVNCPECLAELKKIRQFRSREGTARYQERRAEERTPEALAATRHQDLITAMALRAAELNAPGGDSALAADLGDVAIRLQHRLNNGK